ncbi:hypothetical protein, partial [Calidithermus roseus]|uniref:hypothetical protein n=1 Tax=Calidithermus roseus TaxID=1644118 RepID=UPI0015FD7812
PVAPASPPALYYGYEGEVGDPAFIEYTNGKYTAAAEYASILSGVAAIAPADAPLKIVIYASWRARWHPLYGRWVRIYPKDPIALRMEGDRLVCEGYRPADWVVEMMPEGFNFPGFDPQRERFDDFKTPYKLPVELDPHAGR